VAVVILHVHKHEIREVVTAVSSVTAGRLRTGPIGYPETSVTTNRTARHHCRTKTSLQHSGSLKSWAYRLPTISNGIIKKS